jgi:hypothetical protein
LEPPQVRILCLSRLLSCDKQESAFEKGVRVKADNVMRTLAAFRLAGGALVVLLVLGTWRFRPKTLDTEQRAPPDDFCAGSVARDSTTADQVCPDGQRPSKERNGMTIALAGSSIMDRHQVA